MFKKIEEMDIALVNYGEFERMKNCVNCDHREVCLIVAKRKAVKANDYTPCSKWKIIAEDDAK